MRLAIIGTRVITELDEAKAVVHAALEKHRPTLMVSGGGKGIDTLAEEIAKRMGIATLIIRPKTFVWDAPHGFRWRNEQILKSCDRVVCIRDVASTTGGSLWTYRRAVSLGIPAEMHEIGVA